MAGAEARALWQRTANRCFVQEDAKRAPKLAYCQSSSSTTKQVDAGPATITEGFDPPGSGFMPINRTRSYSNLPPDTRWWLQMQPNCGYQKNLTYEQLMALEADMETLRAGFVEQTSKNNEVDPFKGESTDGDCKKTGYEVQKKDVDSEYGDNMLELQYEDMRERYEEMGMETIGCAISKQSSELSGEPEYLWMEGGRTEPWWQTTDRDELASLVALKSLDHIENCDLPPPQKLYHKRHPYAPHVGFSDRDGILGTSLDRKAQASGLSNITTNAQGYAGTGITHGEFGSAADEEDSDTSLRDLLDLQQLTEGDPTKAQLIEALCHSQTRAREAEKAAEQAYAEKEHVFKLFFKQASQIFAYKQWFQLLQLEILYVQIKNKDQAVSTVRPVVLPWMSSKGRKPRKSWRKGLKGKRIRRIDPNYMTKYAVALALGFGLVGTGFLLGWTVGWMLPSF